MKSTFPHIVNITPAVLRAVSKEAGQTTEEYRVSTLKRVECEILNLLDPETIELHPDYREAWEDALRQVRIALGGE